MIESEPRPEYYEPVRKPPLSQTDKIVAIIVISAILISIVGIGILLLTSTPSDEERLVGIWMREASDVFVFNADGTGEGGYQLESMTWEIVSKGRLRIIYNTTHIYHYDYQFQDGGNTLELISIIDAAESAGIVPVKHYHRVEGSV